MTIDPRHDDRRDVLDAVRATGADDLRPSRRDRGGPPSAAPTCSTSCAAPAASGSCVPATHGGLEADLPDAMRVLETLARADASVAWTVMIGAGVVDRPRPPSPGDLRRARTPPTPTPSPPACSTRPARSPRSTAATGSTGRWSFASGCEHADVLFGNCVEGFVDGVPQLRGRRVRARRGHDRGHLDGLRPVRHGQPPLPRRRRRRPGRAHLRPAGRRALHRRADRAHLPPPRCLSLVIASVALGIAQGALDDITVLASDKVRPASPPTADLTVRPARAALTAPRDRSRHPTRHHEERTS